jgi:hypothetical protein
MAGVLVQPVPVLLGFKRKLRNSFVFDKPLCSKAEDC